jgi:CheY-like chemotaxis protein
VTDPTVVRVSAVMARQIAHLVRLVDDLLEVSRITRGVIEIEHEAVDLIAAARSAIEISRPSLDAAQHTLSVDLPSESIIVSGDTVRLTQVFANLLTNAAKYTPAGGQIWLVVRRDGERALVSVRDNGIGIPASHLDSIFEMFMQVDRSNRQAQGGLGLGLTIVRSLVAMHGGRVEARSDGVGKGSEFVVEIPALDTRVTQAAPKAALQDLPARRIMVVDDNRDAADTLGALLETLGAQVFVVHSGPVALERLEAFKPDVVLLDIGMPEMDGYEVCRRIRSTPAYRDLLLISLTGWGQEQDYRRSRQAGFDHHMVKPPDIDKLCEVLKGAAADDH